MRPQICRPQRFAVHQTRPARSAALQRVRQGSVLAFERFERNQIVFNRGKVVGEDALACPGKSRAQQMFDKTARLELVQILERLRLDVMNQARRGMNPGIQVMLAAARDFIRHGVFARAQQRLLALVMAIVLRDSHVARNHRVDGARNERKPGVIRAKQPVRVAPA